VAGKKATSKKKTSQSSKHLSKFRKEYFLGTLDEKSSSREPFKQFKSWFTEVQKFGFYEPNAMTLATVDTNMQPSLRIILLKEISKEGFVFFTNYKSKKAKELLNNPKAALLFFWPEMEREVRVEGEVKKVSAAASKKYFASRPFGAKISALVSPQSEVIPGRLGLDKAYLRTLKKYHGKTVSCPQNWGGYCLVPSYFEFWQGRENRLHDRIFFQKQSAGWKKGRLAP